MIPFISEPSGSASVVPVTIATLPTPTAGDLILITDYPSYPMLAWGDGSYFRDVVDGNPFFVGQLDFSQVIQSGLVGAA